MTNFASSTHIKTPPAFIPEAATFVSAFWVTGPCSIARVNERYGRTHCLTCSDGGDSTFLKNVTNHPD